MSKDSPATTTTPELRHKAINVLNGLLKENAEYVNGKRKVHNLSQTRQRLATVGQSPVAAIIACADSRVSPEILFRANLGQLFVIRTAGNTAGGYEVRGSLDYAINHLNVSLVMVLGHTGCGAVGAACSGGNTLPGELGNLITGISQGLVNSGGIPEKIDQAVARNVRITVNELRKDPDGPVAVAEKKGMLLTGAVYDISTGSVSIVHDNPTMWVESVLPKKPRSPLPRPPSGDIVLNELMKENHQYCCGRHKRQGFVPKKRSHLALNGQAPKAAIITCADSRVAPEIMFRAGLGEIFVIRSAGNTAWGSEIMGSLEYAIDHLKVPLVLVLGHTKCGAVGAACSGGDPLPGELGKLIHNISNGLISEGGIPSNNLDLAVSRNVRNCLATLRKSKSRCVAAAEERGVVVKGAVYDIHSGKVSIVSA